MIRAIVQAVTAAVIILSVCRLALFPDTNSLGSVANDGCRFAN